MSNEVDSRVVEMRFDNQQFERNVGQSISTLDKLKAALRLDGASKGLEEVNASADKLKTTLRLDGATKGLDAVNSSVWSWNWHWRLG